MMPRKRLTRAEVFEHELFDFTVSAARLFKRYSTDEIAEKLARDEQLMASVIELGANLANHWARLQRERGEK